MVKINKKKCIGCGACESICPRVFEMEEAKAQVREGEEKSTLPCVQEAISSCPVQAISK